MSMEIGSHMYGEDERFPEVQPTSPALKAASERRCIEGHELCWMHPAEPGREGVQRRESGWLDDGDRDSAQAAKLAGLVKDMDVTCQEIMDRNPNTYPELRSLAKRWQAIRKITQSNQTEAGK